MLVYVLNTLEIKDIWLHKHASWGQAVLDG
jgi:hypothetical protein